MHIRSKSSENKFDSLLFPQSWRRGQFSGTLIYGTLKHFPLSLNVRKSRTHFIQRIIAKESLMNLEMYLSNEGKKCVCVICEIQKCFVLSVIYSSVSWNPKIFGLWIYTTLSPQYLPFSTTGEILLYHNSFSVTGV